MSYQIIRIDGKEDYITSVHFNNYSDAYELLERMYGNLCCSDVDYGKLIYYDIVKIKSKKLNG
tara:strand:- start:184 stop:372 length:189 start_codon:yes stop_codon:yes gene_type:complete